MLVDYPPVKTKVSVKGAIIFSHAYLVKKDKNLALIELDLSSKYADVLGDGVTEGVPCINLWATEHTIKIDKKRKDKATEIEFPEFKNWTIYLSQCSRYTVRICLIKKRLSY